MDGILSTVVRYDASLWGAVLVEFFGAANELSYLSQFNWDVHVGLMLKMEDSIVTILSPSFDLDTGSWKLLTVHSVLLREANRTFELMS